MFFFGGLSGRRQKTVIISFFQTVPTALVHSSCPGSPFCDLSEYIQGGQGQVYDPNTGNPDGSARQPFTGNLIPTDRISPAGAQPAALSFPSRIWLWHYQHIITSQQRLEAALPPTSISIRALTRSVNERFHAFGRYSYFGSKEVGPTALGPAGGDGFGIGGYGGQSWSRNRALSSAAITRSSHRCSQTSGSASSGCASIRRSTTTPISQASSACPD